MTRRDLEDRIKRLEHVAHNGMLFVVAVSVFDKTLTPYLSTGEGLGPILALTLHWLH